MVDITHKSDSLRTAIACAVVKVSKPETIAAVIEKRVPKGDVFEMAKTAGLFAVKRTSDMIPDCHPLPIEFTKVVYEINGLEINIEIEVKTIYKTGVEVEAMHGASVIALTMYDMLKPIDKGIEIRNIRLKEKHGGKSDFKYSEWVTLVRPAVIVSSDSVVKGDKEDTAGKVVLEKLNTLGFENIKYELIPDNPDVLENAVNNFIAKEFNLIIISGGTGLTKNDKVPETLIKMFDKEIPGIMEAARSYGQRRSHVSMLSRGVAGLIGTTLVLTIPGSTKGAEETMDALFPHILHAYKMLTARSVKK